MTTKPTFNLANIGKTLTTLYDAYNAATSTARTALIDAATLVFSIDGNATAFLDNDGKKLTGKSLTNASGKWFKSVGLEPWFVNLCRSHGNAIDIMGAEWTHRQSVEIIKRLAPDLNAKRTVNGRKKLMPKADRKRLVKATLIAAQKLAQAKDTPRDYTGADIQATRDGTGENPKTIADVAAFAVNKASTDLTGNLDRDAWDSFLVFVENATLTVGAFFDEVERVAEAKAEAAAEADAEEADAEAETG